MPNEARMDQIAPHQDRTPRFGRKPLVAAGLIGLIAAALLAFGLVELPRQQRGASRWVEHTLEVLEVAATLDADLATVASEGRGFLLDRTADSVRRFEAASQQVKGDLGGLRALAVDNPAQQAALDRVEPLVAERIDFLRRVIGLLQAGDKDDGMGLVQTQRGRVLADQIRDVVQGIRADERQLLGVRDKAERRTEWLIVAGLAAGGVLAAASGLLVVMLLIGRRRSRVYLANLCRSDAVLRGLNQELEHQAEEFRTLADNIPTLCWMAQADGRIHWFNRRWYDYAGGNLKSHEGRGWESVHDPQVLPRVAERWQHSLDTGEPFEMTFPLKGADGVFRPFLTRVVPVRDAQGRITRWFGANTDIREQREAEQTIARHRDELERLVAERTAELSASEARYRLLTEHASDMVSRIGPDGARLYVSPAAARIFGVAPETLLGQRLLERVVPEDRPVLSACMRRLLSGSVEKETVVYRVLHPQRGEVWVEGVGQVLRDPVTGALDGYVAVSRDVTERHAAEAACRESEARYRMLADSTSDAITTLDLDLRRTYVSPAYRVLFGYEPDAVIGGAPAAIIHLDDVDAVYACLRPLAAGAADRMQATYRVRHKDGRWIWVEANFNLVRDEAGSPASIICTLRDVSERKRAEAAMAQANGWLALGEQVAGLGHWRYEPSSGYLHWSAEIYRIYGLDPDGPPPTVEQAIAAYHPEDRAAVRHALDRAIAERDGYEHLIRLVRPDGEIRHVRSRAIVETGPDGEVAALFGAFIDVTDQVRAAVALRDSEARYRMLVDNTTDAIIVLDLDFRRTYASPACLSIYGYEPEEMLAGDLTATVHPDDQDKVYAQLRRLAAGEAEQERVVNRIRHKHGHLVWVEVSFGLIRDAEGRPSSIICTIRDVSERQAQADALRTANTELECLARHLALARDAAERASRAKSRFLAGMSHELRTPLNGILGYAELLRLDGGLNTAQATRVGAMLGAGQHLLEMINGVLDLSEIEQGHVELRPVEIELRGIADACLDLVRPAADAKGLALTMDMAPGTPFSMVADPTRLRQVLLNLLGNAMKFTAQGAVALRLMAAEDRLRIEVADTGPGVPAERRHRLFQDFERLGAEAGAAEGAGLGLALSARLAALLGGQLGHQDNPGGGSVFWLELPLTAPEADPAPAAAAAAAAGADRLDLPDAVQAASATVAARQLRVLVVDDVAMNRDIAGSFLRAAGHEVACAEGGAEAVKIAATSDFDVVLMDVRMPEMDGLEATRRIRLLAGPRGRVPIVALTAQAFAEQVSECRQAGMDSHLAKPFTPDALHAAVAHAVAAAAPRGEAAMPRQDVEQPVTAVGGEPAGPASSTSAVTTTPALGSELPVLDAAAFERTAVFLAPKSLASYLGTIAKRGEALLCALRLPGALASTGADLAAVAHMLAGSAGMLGFERLSTLAAHFEHAIRSGASDTQTVADGLAAAIEASLLEIPGRVPGHTSEADSSYEPKSCQLA